jgi:hypothetical protein
VSIRLAKFDDVQELLDTGEQFFNLGDMGPRITYDKVVLCKTLINLITDDNCCLFVDDKLQGVIAGVVSPMWFSDNLMGQELLWWVNPEARHSKVGFQLMNKLIKWFEDKGVAAYSMYSLEHSNPEQMDRIYKRKGFTQTEHTYTRIL